MPLSEWSPREARWRRWAAVFGSAAMVLGGCAVVLSEVAPDTTILMLGPFPSGKVMVCLVASALLALGLAVLVPLTIICWRPGKWWGDLLAVALWIPALPCAGIALLVTGLVYDTEPETHRFTVGGHDYLLTSNLGFLQPTDETYLDLYEKDGRLYRRTGLNLETADTDAFDRDGFIIERRREAWLVYRGSSGETERVTLP